MKSEIWTDNEIAILSENYGKMKLGKVSMLLPNRTIPAIRYKALHLGLKADRHITNNQGVSFNEDFFAEPNIINSYWAGLIAADGCIGTNSNKNSVVLHQKDLSVLKLFQKTISHNGKISVRASGPSRVGSINLRSQKMTLDLEQNFNIIPRKSLILKPPNLTYLNRLAYIVGYIDGDGHIYISYTKNKKPTLVIGALGTEDMMTWIKTTLDGVGCVFRRKDCKSILYKYTTTGKNALLIANKMNLQELKYIRFARKWNKIDEYKLGCSS